MRRARILVVDDERQNVEILSRLLRMKGHEVASAGSAEEAAQVLAAGAFDLVLLDLVLPGMSGLQAIAQFRALTKAAIHVMSGQSDGETRRDALLLGATGFLAKPLDFAALDELVAALPEPPA